MRCGVWYPNSQRALAGAVPTSRRLRSEPSVEDDEVGDLTKAPRGASSACSSLSKSAQHRTSWGPESCPSIQHKFQQANTSQAFTNARQVCTTNSQSSSPSPNRLKAASRTTQRFGKVYGKLLDSQPAPPFHEANRCIGL